MTTFAQRGDPLVRRVAGAIHVDLHIAPSVYALFAWSPSEGWTAWGWRTDGQIIGQDINNPPRIPAGALQDLLSRSAGYPERDHEDAA